ncbi:MAG: DNA polymerase/3'-5' exonuclease PolX [Aquificae bacterium]|nr:DNA polymerase/3'-5' exonuclease PolX [Aquificota bacterium]
MSKKNQELARIFERMADILEFLGENQYRIRTYRRVANLLSELPEDVESAFKTKKLHKMSGIGSSTLEKIEEFLRTGKITKYEELRKKVPESLLELLDAPGVGPKTLRIAYDKLGIKTKEDFIKALKEGKFNKIKGFGPQKAEKILKGLEIWEKSKERIPLIEAHFLAQEVLEHMKKLGNAIQNISVAGSLRRKKETIGDIDILVSAPRERWAEIHEHFTSYDGVVEVLAKGETKSSVVLQSGRQVDLRTVEPKQWGSALQYFTGSKQHNIRIRDIAKEKGLKINEYGVFRLDTGERIGGEREEEVYELLGMQMPPPEIREDWGEIELALEHKLPRLVEPKDVKGELHMHTNWSDGVNTLEEMVHTAYKLGYQYIVVGDHSQSARVANGLDPERYKKQWKEIERLNKEYNPKGFYILKGAEVDILPDGSLDLPDEILEEMDFVIASIHSRFEQDNTERIIKAMRNPYVNMIGHPTGRQYGYREGYPVDINKLIEEAKRTNTALELNTQRMDLSSENVRKAVEAGAHIGITTDAHSAKQLALMPLGVGLARRGWAVPELVINTYDLDELMKFVRKKREKLARA